MTASRAYDFLIIGAGIAGVSLAYRIGNRARVLLIEAESQPGYHSTGRSAAMYMETYGTPTIRAMTSASRDFFQSPPEGFSPHSLLKDRGVLYLVREDQVGMKQETLQQLLAAGANVCEVSADAVLARVPCVAAEGLVGAIQEPDAKDVDVHALLQGFLKGARKAGTELAFKTTVTEAVPQDDRWDICLSDGRKVVVGAVVNAAGAWAQRVADQFGAINVGLQPKRRTAFTFKPVCVGMSDPLSAETIEKWPAVVSIDESFYFKPDAGQLLGSSANVDPVDPHDVVAEELDVALGIDRITTATTLEIRRPTHTWAGLRSFVADGDFVIGWDPKAFRFFWLAAQGGYGIQTSPGASMLASNLLLGEPIDVSLTTYSVDPANVSPTRFEALDR